MRSQIWIAAMIGAALAGSALSAPPVRKKPGVAPPAVAAAKPYEVRGVPLGITLAEFRAIPILDPEGYWDLRTYCTGDDLPRGLSVGWVAGIDEQGVSCQWFSRAKEPLVKIEGLKRQPAEPLRQHSIRLAETRWAPTFDFIYDGSTFRLFRISFPDMRSGYGDLRSALTHIFGTPREVREDFQVKAGSIFPNLLSRWSNGVSDILLEERCYYVDRSCLTYSHAGLMRIYNGLLDKRAAEAASKL